MLTIWSILKLSAAMIQLWTSLLSLLSVVSAVHLPVERQTNDGVHLAITPVCGKLGGTFANANAGVVTTGIKTLVAFGARSTLLIYSHRPLMVIISGLVHLWRAQ
jgi:hypothetical protein